MLGGKSNKSNNKADLERWKQKHFYQILAAGQGARYKSQPIKNFQLFNPLVEPQSSFSAEMPQPLS